VNAYTFETIVEAPGGLALLREVVLDVALRGRLSGRFAADVPARALLADVANRKARLVGAGELLRLKPLPELPAQHAFPLPQGWAWAHLADVLPRDLTDGDWVESKDQDPSGSVRLTQLADVGVDAFLDKSDRFLTAETAARLRCTFLEPGDVLIARLPRPLGRACVYPGSQQPAITVVDVAIARRPHEGVAPRYLVHLMNSSFVRRQVSALAAGTTRERISTGNLRRLVVPVPPLAEQHRIVSKVDELMGLIASTEREQLRRDSIRRTVRDAMLSAMTSSDTAEAQRHAWQRIAGRFEDLVLTPGDIDSMRRVVLSLAMRGRLVSQSAHDRPASETLEDIARARGSHVRADKARYGHRSIMSADQQPFALPVGWTWARVPEIADVRLGKMLDKAKNRGSLRPYLRNKNVQWFRIDLEDLLELRLEDADLDEYTVRTGDLLICEGGEPGRAAVCGDDVEGIVIQKAIHRVRPLGGTNPRYLAYLLRADTWSGRLERYFTGATIKHLTGKALASYPIPLPPIEEQHRIVDRIDSTMSLLEQLEANLVVADETQRQLARVAIERLIA